MADWNPALYRRFEDERTRPAIELLARVPLQAARRVVDLGCGPGNSTELLIRRFAHAQVVGIDNSPAMLEAARERLAQCPGVRCEERDITDWAQQSPRPEAAPDLIFSNAALQWVGGHAALIPRLFARLAPGGVLAIQVPDNAGEPSHCLMQEVAAQAPWAEHSRAPVRRDVLDVRAYYDLLAPVAAHVDVWRTVYHHALASPAALVEWLRSTGLRPYVERLPQPLQASYLAEYERRMDAAYPCRADGRRLLAFPRLFIVAHKI